MGLASIVAEVRDYWTYATSGVMARNSPYGNFFFTNDVRHNMACSRRTFQDSRNTLKSNENPPSKLPVAHLVPLGEGRTTNRQFG